MKETEKKKAVRPKEAAEQTEKQIEKQTEVRQLLCYMENTVYENAVNEDLREIHRMVETVKRDSKVIRMRIQIVEDIMKQAREITRLGEENKKLEEENKKLKEELARKNSAGHIDI